MSIDAVLIPGGGLSEDGSPAEWVKSRLDAAYAAAGDPWLLPLSAGTPHKPPKLTANGFPIFESHASAEYLLRLGCSPARILLDTWSLDTIGNAFFARLAHCDPRGWKNLLVITSQFHLPRTRMIFDWIFRVKPLANPVVLSYQEVPNVGLPPEALKAREAKEHQAISQLIPTIESIQTLEELHRFVFTGHDAYRHASPAKKSFPLNRDLTASY